MQASERTGRTVAEWVKDRTRSVDLADMIKVVAFSLVIISSSRMIDPLLSSFNSRSRRLVMGACEIHRRQHRRCDCPKTLASKDHASARVAPVLPIGPTPFITVETS